MKFTALVGILFIIGACTNSKNDNYCQEDQVSSEQTLYDSLYAEKLGADEYGMKSYVIAFLKEGPNRPSDQVEIDSLFRLHMDNINRLAEEGSLVVAGPFAGNGELKGIYIFNVDNIDEARKLTETDPAIQYGSLTMELHRWYGSAGLMQVNEIHKRVAKKQV